MSRRDSGAFDVAMTDTSAIPDESSAALRLVIAAAETYLAELDRSDVMVSGPDDATSAFGGDLPEDGDGAIAALTELIERGTPLATRSSGPRFFHFVTGGVTPAALGADWLTSTLDQNAFSWVGSPLGSRLEAVAIEWLKDLFELPRTMGGVLTSGATMANFVALAAARRWWAQQLGVDVEEAGMSVLPQPRVVASGYIHSSDVKALAMLGIGRSSVKVVTRDDVGRVDLHELEAELRRADGPAIVIASAGEVNAGDFDPIDAMADLAEAHGAWLHVDGAFGLFARLSPRTADLARGVERAQSVIADGHKWLNVPYDCGFAFVADPMLLPGAFTATAAYLPSPLDPNPNFGYSAPDMSRRARSLAVWATLRAYGRSGYRGLIEQHLDLANTLARRVDEAPDLERLAEVPLNVVCFRFVPPGVPEADLDDLNERLAAAIVADGRVFLGGTRYAGRAALRPAIVNWRTTEADMDVLVEVVREIGHALAGADDARGR